MEGKQREGDSSLVYVAAAAWGNPVATYTFNGNYNAIEGGEPPLVYHHVVLTQSGGTVTGYLDGVQQFSALSSVMVIPAGNPLFFFMDDSATGFGEYSSSKVALIRLFDSALTAGDVTTLYSNGSPIDLALGPTAGSAPEPSTAVLLLSGLGVACAVRRRRSRG